MTDDIIKEHLSNHYVNIVASSEGYYLEKPSNDFGVDFQVRYNVKYPLPGNKFEYFVSPNMCELQIKATTSKKIKFEGNNISYDLRAKNYRDLIRRRDQRCAPLFLILFVLPDEKKSWIRLFENRITLSKHAYWFIPDDSYQDSTNITTVNIKIPTTNKLHLNFFKEKIDEWYGLSK